MGFRNREEGERVRKGKPETQSGNYDIVIDVEKWRTECKHWTHLPLKKFVTDTNMKDKHTVAKRAIPPYCTVKWGKSESVV